MPVRLCPLPGPLYTVLMGYKEAPLSEARHRFAGIVDALCNAFLRHHAACLAAVLHGPVDFALPVPSTSRRGRTPLDLVPGLPAHVEEAVGPPGTWSPGLLRHAGGPIGHMRPNASAFAVPSRARPALAGARVLLLDDTYVSGSRAQSAAAALRLAGAGATLIVPLGRVLRPDRSPLHAAFLRRSEVPADAGTGPDRRLGPGATRCCRCVQTEAAMG